MDSVVCQKCLNYRLGKRPFISKISKRLVNKSIPGASANFFIEIDARINRFSYWKRKVHSGIILVSADVHGFSWMMGSFYMNILEISSQSEVISHLDM